MIYTLPANFSINPTVGEVSKKEAISDRIAEIFSNHKGKIAALALLTLPLFPISWSAGYLIIRRIAKNDVANAIAEKRIELLKKDGIIPKAKNELSNNDIFNKKITNETNPRQIAQNDFKEQLKSQENELRKYFKKEKHTKLIINSPFIDKQNIISNKKKWDLYKKTSISIFRQIEQIRTDLKQKYRMTDQQIEHAIYERLKNSTDCSLNEKKITNELTNVNVILENLQEISHTEEAFKILSKDFTKIDKNALTGHIKNGFDNSFNSEEEKIVTHINNLPIYSTTLRDAMGSLPPFFIDQMYSASPSYSHLCEENSPGTKLKNDEGDIILKTIIKEKILSEITALYNKILNNNSAMNTENKEYLWKILQLARTQALLYNIDASIIEFTGLAKTKKIPLNGLHYSFARSNMNNNDLNTQNTFVRYNYNEEKNLLNITVFTRTHLEGFGGKLITAQPLSHNFYYAVETSIDLNNAKLEANFNVVNLRVAPSNEKTIFDRLPPPNANISREAILALQENHDLFIHSDHASEVVNDGLNSIQHLFN